jgi:inosine-uridine nucleoside N-ribohydrolase
MLPMTPLYIDADNAIEAPSGDVDDAFAIAAILCAGLPVAAIGAVAGNTSEAAAAYGNRELARRCGFRGVLLRGEGRGSSEAARWLVETSGALRVAALGPLTNVAEALRLDPAVEARIERLVLVGGNRSTKGRWPPLWPWEFNLWKNREAAGALFASKVPITIVPLDVAKRLTARGADLRALRGPIGAYLRERSNRWLWRARILKLRDRFPVWDLVAAMYLVDEAMFRVERSSVRSDARGLVELGRGGREVDVVASFDRDEVWSAFARLVER